MRLFHHNNLIQKSICKGHFEIAEIIFCIVIVMCDSKCTMVLHFCKCKFVSVCPVPTFSGQSELWVYSSHFAWQKIPGEIIHGQAKITKNFQNHKVVLFHTDSQPSTARFDTSHSQCPSPRPMDIPAKQIMTPTETVAKRYSVDLVMSWLSWNVVVVVVEPDEFPRRLICYAQTTLYAFDILSQHNSTFPKFPKAMTTNGLLYLRHGWLCLSCFLIEWRLAHFAVNAETQTPTTSHIWAPFANKKPLTHQFTRNSSEQSMHVSMKAVSKVKLILPPYIKSLGMPWDSPRLGCCKRNYLLLAASC